MTPADIAAHAWGGRVVRTLRDRENHVFEIALADGKRAALRLHRSGYQSSASIRSELWWCAALAKAGLPVPEAIPTLNGDYLLGQPDGRQASVIAWIDGEPLGEASLPFARPLTEVLDHYHTLGAVLARVHQATDALTLPDTFTRPRWDVAGLVGDEPLWGRFWDHPAASADQRQLLRYARDALQERLAGEIGLIHADVLRENVLVNGRSISLIDFDDSGFGFRLYDLGTALVQTVHHPAQADLRAALMHGYGTTDDRMVQTFTLARTLASVGWTVPRLAADDPIHKSHLARAEASIRQVLG
jgi:Ser/Thr protein kinase RdoA (MazF antagonist)